MAAGTQTQPASCSHIYCVVCVCVACMCVHDHVCWGACVRLHTGYVMPVEGKGQPQVSVSILPCHLLMLHVSQASQPVGFPGLSFSTFHLPVRAQGYITTVLHPTLHGFLGI